jgi:hypothetical protein
MRLVAATILILALAACADSKPGYIVAKEQDRQVNALREHYYSDLGGPEFTGLAGKVNLHLIFPQDEDPCAAIGPDRLPTAEEQAALRHWAALRGTYIAQVEAIVMQEPNGSSQVRSAADQFDAVLDNGLRSQSALIANLAGGRLTYCQFATEAKALTDDLVREAGSLQMKILQARKLDWGLSHSGEIGNPYAN